MALFLTAETAPFGVALALLIGLAVIEALGMALSFSPGHAIDHLVADAEGDGPLGWLHIGRTPIMVLLILFLAGFGLSGYAAQGAIRAASGHFAPAWLVAAGALVVGVGAVRGLGGLISRLVPRDETASVSEQSLIGRAGVIMRGDARRDMAAEARVRDANGATHYLMVEPDIDDETLDEGADVLLVRKIGVVYRAIRNPHPQVL